jgi:MFS family permease
MADMAPALDHPLRHASYRWLLSGVAVNSLGNGIAPVALAFAVLDLGGDASDLGVVVGLYALADVASVLFGGVLGDRLPRTVMMQGSSALAAVAQGLVAASLVGGWSSIPLLAGPRHGQRCSRGTGRPELVGDHPADGAPRSCSGPRSPGAGSARTSP